MSFIRWIIGFVVAVALSAFAVYNRHSVDIVWSPVHEPAQLPLYLVVLGLTAFGFVLGGSIVWVSAAPTRRLKRQQKREIKNLEKKLESAATEAEPAKPPSDFFPALPQWRKSSK